MNAPSLLASAPTTHASQLATSNEAKTLLELMYNGFYMLFLLRGRGTPTDAASFRAKVREFLLSVERGSRQFETSAKDIYLVKYAFCALVDEMVLMGQPALRADWESRPLQLEFFGEQLAGENFFVLLEECREQGLEKLQVLEVFHMCLLMGFQGKYLIEGSEKLGYLSARLGDEIAHLKGRRAEFAPHATPPDRLSHKLRAEVPLWVLGSMFALAAVLAFMGVRGTLQQQTERDLARYSQLVKLPAQQAHVTITLP
ncbi:DotU family type IV/VI secretion system protein [Roseateles sp. BYS180W]|uniref:DotU family type IV/VI secretion system protein n=1 Tax=Roseateles rivi TaxID=3299028 RepID=A0ABW7FRZ5_9BURK